MKILLFNDNPVVRKLVALSAQKTKDDLSVVWSVDEIEGSEYDLLIVDDALYSDDMFESLDERVRVKSKLLMATRGNGIPAGFDHVINKPFLPTDLVDMLVQIDKKVVGASNHKEDIVDEVPVNTPVYSINLEDTLPDIEHQEDDLLKIDELDNAEDDEFDFSHLEDFEEKLPETGILDHEEVQEVQGLLEDTEEDTMDTEEDIVVQGIDEFDFPEDEPEIAAKIDEIPSETMDEDSFDDVLNEDALNLENDITDKELLEEDFGEIEFPSSFEDENEVGEEKPLIEEESLDENGLEDLDISSFMNEEESTLDESGLEDLDISSLMNDDELNHLEAKIEDAVSGLENDDLERELASDDFGVDFDDDLMEDMVMKEEVTPVSETKDTSDFDELDMLDERELKRAIGEEVEDDDDVDSFDEDEENSPMIEELEDEADEKTSFDELSEVEAQTPHAEGAKALKALLRALSNEEVAASLKGMNISININFGNEK